MLYLSRKVGQSVVINDTIEVSVVEVRGKSVKLGFTFPSDVSVLRQEIHQRIQEENRAAAGASLDLFAPGGPDGDDESGPGSGPDDGRE